MREYCGSLWTDKEMDDFVHVCSCQPGHGGAHESATPEGRIVAWWSDADADPQPTDTRCRSEMFDERCELGADHIGNHRGPYNEWTPSPMRAASGKWDDDKQGPALCCGRPPVGVVYATAPGLTSHNPMIECSICQRYVISSISYGDAAAFWNKGGCGDTPASLTRVAGAGAARGGGKTEAMEAYIVDPQLHDLVVKTLDDGPCVFKFEWSGKPAVLDRYAGAPPQLPHRASARTEASYDTPIMPQPSAKAASHGQKCRRCGKSARDTQAMIAGPDGKPYCLPCGFFLRKVAEIAATQKPGAKTVAPKHEPQVYAVEMTKDPTDIGAAIERYKAMCAERETIETIIQEMPFRLFEWEGGTLRELPERREATCHDCATPLTRLEPVRLSSDGAERCAPCTRAFEAKVIDEKRRAAEAKCDCGGRGAGSTHSKWCGSGLGPKRAPSYTSRPVTPEEVKGALDQGKEIMVIGTDFRPDGLSLTRK